jgi:hypothetical protein
MKYLSHYSHSPNRVMNPELSQYELGLSNTRSQQSVETVCAIIYEGYGLNGCYVV